MKILLDENINVKFKTLFSNGSHEVYTVRDMQWNGKKNGTLLQLIKEHNFDCWIVVDKNLPYQQNVSLLPCIVVILDVYRNTLRHISPLVPDILHRLENTGHEKVIIISEVKQ